MEAGAGSFSADDLLAVGKALCGKSVGDLEHGAAAGAGAAAVAAALPPPPLPACLPACFPCWRQSLLCLSAGHDLGVCECVWGADRPARPPLPCAVLCLAQAAASSC